MIEDFGAFRMDAPVWHLSPHIKVIHPSSGGDRSRSLLGRVPDLPGAYAWHRGYRNLVNADDPDSFLVRFREEVQKPHCVARRARLGPAYRVSLESSRQLSKLDALESALARPGFMSGLQSVLMLSVFLQAPLYVGKASVSLKSRAKQHLDGSSGLKERLRRAGEDLSCCSLLIIQSSAWGKVDVDWDDDSSRLRLQSRESTNEQEPEVQSNGSEIDEVGEQGMDELLCEEVLSRLFLPTFTVRYA